MRREVTDMAFEADILYKAEAALLYSRLQQHLLAKL